MPLLPEVTPLLVVLIPVTSPLEHPAVIAQAEAASRRPRRIQLMNRTCIIECSLQRLTLRSGVGAI